MSQVHKFPLYLAAGVSMLGLAGCVYDPYYPPPSSGYVYGAGPEVIYHDYYYYPSVQVYFHISTGYYWYLSGSRWIYTRYLPAHIHLHPRDRIKITAPRDRPYKYHQEHQKRYRPAPDYRPDTRFDREEREHNRLRYDEYRTQPPVQKRPPPDYRAEPRGDRDQDEYRRRYEEYMKQQPDYRAEPRNEREREEDRRRYEEYLRKQPGSRAEPRSEREREEDRRRYEDYQRQVPGQENRRDDSRAGQGRTDREQRSPPASERGSSGKPPAESRGASQGKRPPAEQEQTRNRDTERVDNPSRGEERRQEQQKDDDAPNPRSLKRNSPYE